jgi:hypothetical protein
MPGDAMSEIDTSMQLGKRGGRQPTQAVYANWGQLKPLRKILTLIVLAAVLILGAEAISAYVLYRHFSNLHHNFYPAGSATAALARSLIAKLEGRHDELDLSIDHGPLFHSDADLGYTLYPGSYQITEKRAGLIHRFNLTVDGLGRRITSYQAGNASRRMYIAGDSALFGWGLDDEQTLPWMLQARFPEFEVINLSLTSYSTVQAMVQLERTNPHVTPDDIVVLTYHPITMGFNVASAEMLGYLKAGVERQLGDSDLVRSLSVPFGSVDDHDRLVVGRFEIACANQRPASSTCARPEENSREAMLVTERAFDAILAAHTAHFVVAFLKGSDSDPVIRYLRSKGVLVADLRTESGDPDANDELPTDGHSGPFWHHRSYERLADALRRAHLVG